MMGSILLVTPSIHMGGMQRAMVNLANEMADQGLTVHLLSIYRLTHFFKLDERINFIEPPVHIQSQNRVVRFFSTASYLRREAARLNVEKVLVFGRFYGALTLVAFRGLGLRIFISDRASAVYRDALHVDWATRLIYTCLKPHGIICQTNDSLLFQQKRFGTKVPKIVIPNPVAKMALPKVEKENYVLAVGRFGDALKGFDRLIEAWCLTKVYGWKLVFAGGDEQDAIREGFVDRLKQAQKIDSVLFLGKVQDVATLYAQSKVFVIPSRSEGFPNALLEAMCAHVACIAFDFHSGPRDLINHMENGIIVPDGNIKELAEKITLLVENEDIRERIANSNNYVDTYSSFNIVNKFIEFIFNGHSKT